MRTNHKCSRCILCESATTRCVAGRGNPKAKLMLVGEAPGSTEDRVGEPFRGQAGDLLTHILNKLGLNEDDLFITNVLRCRPPNNKLPNKKELLMCWLQCGPYLLEEIKQVRPKVILLMGNTPLQLMAQEKFISKWEGMKIDTLHTVITKGKRRFVSTLYASYHPAAALRGPRLEKNIATAIYVAAKAAGLKPKPKGQEAGMYPYEIRG